MAKKNPSSKIDSVLPLGDVLKYLYHYGYFGGKSWKDAQGIRGAELQKAVRAYQRFNGLPENGKVNEVTAHRIRRHRCGLPDFNISGSKTDPCKWPMREITYYHEITMPGVSPEQVRQAFDTAIDQWAAVCDIEPVRVDTPSEANIYSRSGAGKKYNLDGEGGTLAWSELPCGVHSRIQLEQMYDEAEDWSYNMAVAVMCHELGHALGLAHLSWGNLMAPYYDPNVIAPQSGDIEEIVKLYGARKKPYTAQKSTTNHVHGTIVINGQPYVLVPQT